MTRNPQISKKLVPVAGAALLAFAAVPSFAQSSVTLFGVVDAGVRYVENGNDNNITSASSNGANTSRLGVRGVEDLGDGLKAGFWLETGLNPDTGTVSDSTRFWNRRSTVSLAGKFGEVRLGRDYTPTYLAWSDFDVFGDNGIGAGGKFATALGSTADTLTRGDNQVQYFTPSGLGGFYANLSAAAGEGTSGKKYYGGRAGWASGPLNVSVGYGETTVTAASNGDDKFKVGLFGASYDFGVVKVLGYFAQQKYADLKVEVANIGVAVPLGAGTLRADYTKADSSGVNSSGVDTSANDAQQFAIGYLYNLSKRTALYGTIAKVTNDGAAAFAVASSPALAGGKDSTGYEVGIRHSF